MTRTKLILTLYILGVVLGIVYLLYAVLAPNGGALPRGIRYHTDYIASPPAPSARNLITVSEIIRFEKEFGFRVYAFNADGRAHTFAAQLICERAPEISIQSQSTVVESREVAQLKVIGSLSKETSALEQQCVLSIIDETGKPITDEPVAIVLQKED